MTSRGSPLRPANSPTTARGPPSPPPGRSRVRLLQPGELAKHAGSEGAKYTSSKLIGTWLTSKQTALFRATKSFERNIETRLVANSVCLVQSTMALPADASHQISKAEKGLTINENFSLYGNLPLTKLLQIFIGPRSDLSLPMSVTD